MPYAVEPVKFADAPGLSRTMINAFIRDERWAAFWSDMTLEEIIEGTTQRLPWELTKSREKRRHQKVVDNETGEIVGYARWVLPDSGMEWLEAQVTQPTPEEAQEFQARWSEFTVDGSPKGFQIAVVNELVSRVEREVEPLIKNEVHLSLDYIATHPSHQGKGIGALLIRRGLIEADKVGIKAIVMSTPAGKKFYERCGFQLVTTVQQEDPKHSGSKPYFNYFLVRQPGNLHEEKK